jgi:hypothetical protein
MKFGLLLNTQFPPGESASKRLEGLLDQVRAARDNGLHSVWVSQHYLASPFQMLQQMPVLGRMAAEAGSMHIGTNIFCCRSTIPCMWPKRWRHSTSSVAAASSSASASLPSRGVQRL